MSVQDFLLILALVLFIVGAILGFLKIIHLSLGFIGAGLAALAASQINLK